MDLVFENDLLVMIPELFFIFAVGSLLIFGAVYGTRLYSIAANTEGEKESSVLLTTPMNYLCSLSLLLGAALTWHASHASGAYMYGSLYVDSLTVNAKGGICVMAAFCLLASTGYMKREGIYAFEYGLLILMTTVGLGLMLTSYNFLSLYLALETQALGLYVLASIKRGSAYATEAGLKYFIVGAFSSGLLLFGMAMIYGATGTLSMEDMGRLVMAMDLGELKTELVVGLVFLSAGLLFKVAAAPFHMWIPDVYEGAPTSASLYFAVVPKLAILVVLMRVYYLAFYDLMPLWQNFLIAVSLFSMLVAVMGALYQRKIKRFLAYSSIGHVAYMLIGLGAGSIQGLQSMLVYTVIYMFMSLTMWTILLTTKRTAPHMGDQGPMKYMDELAILGKLNPALGISLSITIFSMAGIPPLAGFCAKLYVFFAAMESALYSVAILGVLASVVAAYYYLRWVKIMYFEKSVPQSLGVPFFSYALEVDREKALIISACTFFLLFFFAHPAPLLILSHQMALALCV